jgi:NADPH-dependent ferric siderophore reductase
MAVGNVDRLGLRMVRVTFSGPDMAGLTVEQPAASVRLLVPPPGAQQLVVPTWNGNEFLMPDGGADLVPGTRVWVAGDADDDA